MDATFAVIAVIALGVLALALGLALARARRSPEEPHPEPTKSGSELSASQFPEPADGDEVVIVPLPSGLDKALVMGSAADLALLDEMGLTEKGPTENPKLISQTVRRALAGGGYASNEVAKRGIDSGRIVKLAPESVKALEKGRPVFDKSKNMLGIVKGDKGKISHVMRIEQGGAKAMLASNAATLAVTAALSLQLEQIQEQLEEINAKLDTLIDDLNRRRLAEAMGLNATLLKIWNDIQTRGEISQSEVMALASTRNDLESLQRESQLKFAGLGLPDNVQGGLMNRRARVEKLEDLEERHNLKYWFMFRIQAELAATRHDLLSLLVEQQAHPQSAAVFARQTQERIETRSSELEAFAAALRELTDPSERARFDSLRIFSKRSLQERQELVGRMLDSHPRALARPNSDPFQVDLAQLPELTDGVPRRPGIDGS